MGRIYASLVCLVLLSIFQPLPAETYAQSVYGDWTTGATVDHDTTTSQPDDKGCTVEKWRIKRGDAFYSEPDVPLEVCLYRAHSFVYAYYSREVGSHEYRYTEKGFAVAQGVDIDAEVLVPVLNWKPESVIYQNVNQDLYTLRTNERYYGQYLEVTPDFLSHLKYDGSLCGYLFDGYRKQVSFQNEKLEIHAHQERFSGNWLVLATSYQLLRFNMINEHIDELAHQQYDGVNVWPGPYAEMTISHDGSLVAITGNHVGMWIVDIDEACAAKTDYNYSAFGGLHTDVNSPCSSRNLTSIANRYTPPSGQYSGGLRSYSSPRITSDKSTIVYRAYDEEGGAKWHTLSINRNRLPQYLALGDSFASGEGDVVPGHYLLGTNVDGDYSIGIPRERCHQSDRSYPLLLMRGMDLERRLDANTVACGGAVRSDILSVDRSDGIDVGYLGQMAPMPGWSLGSVPRLALTPNPRALQDEARERFIPGRVQQIEFLKKTQPKVATVMIGGNDLSFGPMLSACLFQDMNPLHGTACDLAGDEQKSAKVQEIYQMRDKLVAFYDKLKQASPQTQFYVIGYPKFVSTHDTLCAKDQLTIGMHHNSRQAINELVEYADATIRSAAATSGMKYIDISDALGSHALCGEDSPSAVTGISSKLLRALWTELMKHGEKTTDDIESSKGMSILASTSAPYIINQLLIASTTGLLDNVLNYNQVLESISQELMHPNALGHKMIYTTMSTSLGEKLLYSDVCNAVIICPTDEAKQRPPLSEYAPGMSMQEGKVIIETVHDFSLLTAIKNSPVGESVGAMRAGVGTVVKIGKQQLIATLENEISGRVILTLHSDEQVFGAMVLGSDDVYRLVVRPSITTPAGYHILHLLGKLEDGRSFDVYKRVFVIGPEGDLDNDGVKDSDDTCAFAAPSGVDLDRNDVDDECQLSEVEPTPSDVQDIAHSDGSQSVGLVKSYGELTLTSLLPQSQAIFPENDSKGGSVLTSPSTSSSMRLSGTGLKEPMTPKDSSRTVNSGLLAILILLLASAVVLVTRIYKNSSR